MCIATTQQLNYNSKKNGVMVSAAAPSGLRMLPLILCGYVFNTAFYFAVKTLLPYAGWDFTVDSQHCPGDEPSCVRTDLAAFQVVALVNLSYLGLLGVYSYYISNKGAKNALPNTPQGRIFGRLLDADYVNAGIVVFQGWDFVASIFFEEHCTMIMMTHHLLAFICGLYSLEYGVSRWSDFKFASSDKLLLHHSNYNAVYFGGVSEFSSIFLALSTLFQYHPPSALVPDDSSHLPMLKIRYSKQINTKISAGVWVVSLVSNHNLLITQCSSTILVLSNCGKG
eukprot:scaffold3254_cov140-Skeletonema_menzelii.AAC.6